MEGRAAVRPLVLGDCYSEMTQCKFDCNLLVCSSGDDEGFKMVLNLQSWARLLKTKEVVS